MRKKTETPAPAWHPDFRDPTTLPDVKAVRTSFFINGVTVLILLVAALYLVFQEYERSNLKNEIRALEQQIEEHDGRNTEVLGLHRDFQAEKRYIDEVVDYLDESISVSELLVALGETLYPEMSFATVRYQNISERGNVVGKEIRINGTIAAAPDAAASVVTDYLRVFDEHSFLEEIVAEAVPTSLVPSGDNMAFGIQLILKEGEE